jgi:enoyl-CoA hydratase/carnithine racemase
MIDDPVLIFLLQSRKFSEIAVRVVKGSLVRRSKLVVIEPQGSVDLIWSEPVARIVMNCPQKRNALSLCMWKAIPHLIAEISANPRVSVVVVQGAGTEAFAAGANIVELEDCLGSAEKGAAYMDAVENAENSLLSCGLPVIAAIAGFCIGAGLEIAMACDLRIATDDSTFAAPTAKLGANYGHSSTRRLVELVGVAKAKDMLFTGRHIGAAEACRNGLVDYVTSREMFDNEVDGYVQTLLSNSLYSIQVAKLTIEDVRDGGVSESPRVRSFRKAGFLHDDFREGISAFRERRKPSFQRNRFEIDR